MIAYIIIKFSFKWKCFLNSFPYFLQGDQKWKDWCWTMCLHTILAESGGYLIHSQNYTTTAVRGTMCITCLCHKCYGILYLLRIQEFIYKKKIFKYYFLSCKQYTNAVVCVMYNVFVSWVLCAPLVNLNYIKENNTYLIFWLIFKLTTTNEATNWQYCNNCGTACLCKTN